MSLDHIVIAADTLDAGVKWAEKVLGVTPAPGGSHPRVGTHNRLLALGGSYPHVYLEIIAIDPNAESTVTPNFDLTDPKLRARLRDEGPLLVAWVARPDTDIDSAVERLRRRTPPVDVGKVVDAQRGTLRWKLTSRDDGKRVFEGVFPRLIQWSPGTPHPSTTIPPSGIELAEIRATHPDASVPGALKDAGLEAVLPVANGRADLVATLRTPNGVITLHSGE